MSILAGRNRSALHNGLFLLFAIGATVLLGCSGPSPDAGAKLEAGFLNPPESARPRVWWHWMNGNITKGGIKADLEWMKRAGFGGFQSFDADISTPQIVEKRLVYMTPEWKDAFLYSAKLADSLGLEMAVAGSPGWSESGGPWVTPAHAMKKLVWSEIRIAGGKSFTGILPKPPSTTGSFQNIPIGSRRDTSRKPLSEYYSDAAVVAYRIPENDLSVAELNPVVASSSGKFDLSAFIDGDLSKTVFLPIPKDNDEAWVEFQFTSPVKISAISLVCTPTGFDDSGFDDSDIKRTLEISDDGRTFIPAFGIPETGNMERTFNFKQLTARIFRITFKTPGWKTLAGLTGSSVNSHKQGPSLSAGIRIAEILLHTIPRVNRFEDKAGFTSASGLYSLASAAVPVEDAVKKSDVIDLTSRMHPDGKLDWTPPDGKWAVIRFGYSLTGHQNAPASPEATGFEVDKLNADYVRSYFDNYLDQYKNATNGLMGKRGLHYLITDSWEAGVQNWTDSMLVEFSRHRGYSMLPWMPVLTGKIIGSAEESDRFLWDFRKTISDLTAEKHYDQLTDILHNRDMERYTESHEGGRAFIADGMEVKRKADIPMSALWTPNNVGGTINTGYKADVRESASVAHIYGKPLVAVESMTSYGSPWAWSPESLKSTADMELACGANRFVQSVSVHSPSEDKLPGLSLGPYGPWLNRHETWAEQANPWITYLARSSYMLQQGNNVADILWYYGEDNNITALFANKLPDIPSGYDFDFVNSDALLNILSVKESQIVTPDGQEYKILALDPNCRYMTLPVLRKISCMVKAGAVVVGDKPAGVPGLSDDQNEFMALADELWPEEIGEKVTGKGKIYAGYSIASVLGKSAVKPDFGYTKPHDDTEVLYVHHQLKDIEIYWINNRTSRSEDIDAEFRVKGLAPEIWHPETGETEKASYIIKDGSTTVPLRLEPDDAVFIVFRKKAETTSLTLTKCVETQLAVIDGPWNLSFQPDRGAPAAVIMNKLTYWNENTDPGVKYFSGTAAYTKILQAPSDWFKKDLQIWLDLGNVKNVAEVIVNDKPVGTVWKTPFRIELTQNLLQGENKLEVRVTNLWVNRLIGDQQPGVTKKITYTSAAFYSATSPLLPSGLAGPVIIYGSLRNTAN